MSRSHSGGNGAAPRRSRLRLRIWTSLSAAGALALAWPDGRYQRVRPASGPATRPSARPRAPARPARTPRLRRGLRQAHGGPRGLHGAGADQREGAARRDPRRHPDAIPGRRRLRPAAACRAPTSCRPPPRAAARRSRSSTPTTTRTRRPTWPTYRSASGPARLRHRLLHEGEPERRRPARCRPTPARPAGTWRSRWTSTWSRRSARCATSSWSRPAAATTANLGTAVNTAVEPRAPSSSPTATAAPSRPPTPTFDTSYYNHPGVAITASAGDNGYGVEYPAASPYVTAVGGTSLTTASQRPRLDRDGLERQPARGCSAVRRQAVLADRHRLRPADRRRRLRGRRPEHRRRGLRHLQRRAAGSRSAAPAPPRRSSPAVYALAGTPAAGTYPASYPYAHTAQPVRRHHRHQRHLQPGLPVHRRRPATTARPAWARRTASPRSPAARPPATPSP